MKLALMARFSSPRKTSTIRKYIITLITWVTYPYRFSMIIAFEVEDLKKNEEFKVDWKQVESAVREKFPGLKLVYSRADPHGGHLAFS